ncbi:hypothetical protein [Pseudonocardia spinosispora]|uniref:hypothetical protein n=1 Tax=Pseudonocardia spinosispora TaxID=103441 RepID=UPI000686979E|nr:hypothetical protein [Pseudonocardia spinosispora]
MRNISVWPLATAVALALLAGCGTSAPPAPAPAAPPPPAPPPAVAPPVVTPPPPAPPAPAPKQLRIWLTGYSWQDNTPPGSSIVGEPVLHHEAGGSGTFEDPITVAVPGHQGAMDWAPGTKFYLPSVQRYVIVEDSGATGAPAGTDTHLDMWIGGQGGTRGATDDCESRLTSWHAPAQLNPPAGLPVLAGPVYAAGRCNIPG